MQDGEIFGIAQKLKLGKLSDPLRDCPVCMVPWYGTAIYLLIGYGVGFTDWFLTIIPAMGFNVVLTKLFPDKESPGYHHEITEATEAIKRVHDEINDLITALKK